MSRDDIIRMAQEAGISTGGHPMNPWNVYPSDLERFAALVAAATRESMRAGGWRACAVGQRTTQHCGLLETAVLVEREACARELEGLSLAHPGRADLTLDQCIAALRAALNGEPSRDAMANHAETSGSPEPEAWINYNAATGQETIDRDCHSELASTPLYTAPPHRGPHRTVTYVCPVCAASLERQE